MKGPHLLFQVTCQSSDHVLFEKCHVSTNTRPQNSAGDIKHRKTHKPKKIFVIEKILTFDSHQYFSLLFLLYLFWYSVGTLSMDIKNVNSGSPVQTCV